MGNALFSTWEYLSAKSLYLNDSIPLCNILRWHSTSPRALETLFYHLQELMIAMEKACPQPDLRKPPPLPTPMTFHYPGSSIAYLGYAHQWICIITFSWNTYAPSICKIIFFFMSGKLPRIRLSTRLSLVGIKKTLSLVGFLRSGSTYYVLTLEHLWATLISSNASLITVITVFFIYLIKTFLYVDKFNFNFIQVQLLIWHFLIYLV